MSGDADTTTTTQQNNIPQWLNDMMQGSTQTYNNMMQPVQGQATTAAGNMNTNFGQGPQFQGGQNPMLQQFQMQNSQSLSPFYQQMVSQGQNNAAQQAAAQRSDINRQFQNQPGVAQVLGAQAQNNAMLQQNPALYQAFTAQKQAEAGQNQLALAANQSNNQNIMAAQQAQMGAQQAGNQAITQQLGLNMMPLQMQQSLMQTLAAMSGAMSPQTSVSKQE